MILTVFFLGEMGRNHIIVVLTHTTVKILVKPWMEVTL